MRLETETDGPKWENSTKAHLPTFASALLRFFLKLLFGVLAVVTAVAFFAVVVVLMMVGSIKALITGKRRPKSMSFQQFSRFTPSGVWSAKSGTHSRSTSASDILDVEVREVPASVDQGDARPPDSAGGANDSTSRNPSSKG